MFTYFTYLLRPTNIHRMVCAVTYIHVLLTFIEICYSIDNNKIGLHTRLFYIYIFIHHNMVAFTSVEKKISNKKYRTELNNMRTHRLFA